jgi:hypothetical protein
MNIIGRQIISTFSKPVPHDEVERVVIELLQSIPEK